MEPKFKHIVKLIQKFPGVGPRQAARFVLALLDKPEEELKEIGQAIQNLKSEITFCERCFNMNDAQGDGSVASRRLCIICRNPQRDQNKILVVEKVTDLDSVEKTGLYKGVYHVLGGVINPLEGVLPDNLRIKNLESRIKKLTDDGNAVELIIATNPTAPGDTTALYLKDLLKKYPNISITRLARGLASGTHLEYADEQTLKNALEFRK